MRLHRQIGMGALLVLIAAAAVLLLRNASSGPDQGAAAPAEAGMMAYIDPETGDLTTGPVSAGELELDTETHNALRRDDSGLDVVTRADGSKVMNLQGRYQHVSVIHIDANGVKTVCTDNEKSAEHNLNHAPAANPNAPEVK
jgi:hypothetical protein